MKVYLDLDGVLVDLLVGYEDIVGYSLLFANSEYGKENRHEIWSPTFEVDDFWYNLPKMPEADELLAYVEPFKNRVHVLSAPIRANPDQCENQKRNWVEDNTWIEPHRVHIVPRRDKHKFATDPKTGTPNILVDDFAKTIDQWIEAGGIGIHHTEIDKTIHQLHNIL